ncbi:RNA-directed DNA polymerase, eukaryota, reverse transcriptase zinc-binding domain protein [Tanacetum coccineum]
MRESHHDYGPSPFRFFHYWFELEGFDTFVKQTWNDAQVTDSNAISMFMKKIKYLKEKIRMWVKANKENSKSHKQCLQEELSKIDLLLDKGEGSSTLISKRMEILKSIQDFVKLDTMELAQKAKIKWAFIIERARVGADRRDEISKVLIQGILIIVIHIDLDFPNKLSLEQQMVLEIEVTREEIKKAVWDCGVDKSPGPDGFTFGFYRRYWTFLEDDVVEAVFYFFNHGQFLKVIQDIAKILANRLVVVLEDLVSDVQSAFVEKTADSRCPTKEFQFHRGLKQGDPLSPFLFLLIMESLHISMQRVVDAGLFRSIQVGSSLQVSHLFYADDVVFMGHWSEANIDTILRVLDCFYHASGLRINMLKSKLMGISVSSDKVDQAAKKIGCAILQVPFSYLGSLPIYTIWPYYKVQRKVLQYGILDVHFFNGIEHNGKKPIWVKWNKVLASKEKGGLGVSSFYALNRALLFKWVWRFCTQQSALWTKIIKGIHGEDGKIGKHVRSHHPSLYVGYRPRRMYALETQKNISVALKLSHDDLLCSFRRAPRAGAEELQYIQLVKIWMGILFSIRRIDGDGL